MSGHWLLVHAVVVGEIGRSSPILTDVLKCPLCRCVKKKELDKGRGGREREREKRKKTQREKKSYL